MKRLSDKQIDDYIDRLVFSGPYDAAEASNLVIIELLIRLLEKYTAPCKCSSTPPTNGRLHEVVMPYDNRFDNIRKFVHENFIAHDDIWMRFDMLVDQLREDVKKEMGA